MFHFITPKPSSPLSTSKKPQKPQGIALLMALIFLIMAFGFAAAFIVLVPMNARTTSYMATYKTSLQIGRLGLSDATGYIQRVRGLNTTYESNDNELANGWSYDYIIEPDINSSYNVTVDISRSGREISTIRAGLKERPLSAISTFTDFLVTPNMMTWSGYGLFKDSVIEGEVFTNEGLSFIDLTSYRHIGGTSIFDDYTAGSQIDKHQYLNGVGQALAPWESLVRDANGSPTYDSDGSLIKEPDPGPNDPRKARSFEGFHYTRNSRSPGGVRQGGPIDPETGQAPWSLDGSQETIVSNYERMVKGGYENMKRSTDSLVPIPEVEGNLSSLAINPLLDPDSITPPTDPGVYVGASSAVEGGVYIEGDVQRMELRVASPEVPAVFDPDTGEEVFPAYPAQSNTFIDPALDTETEIDLGEGNPSQFIFQDLDSSGQVDESRFWMVVEVTDTAISLPDIGTVSPGNVVLRSPDGKYKSYSGDSNGLIYVHGNIRSLRGTNKGPHTIAALDPSIDNNPSNTDRPTDAATIDISGPLLEYGVTPGDRPESPKNVLGLIAPNVFINNGYSRTPTRYNNPDYVNSIDTLNPADYPEDSPLNIYASICTSVEGGNTSGVRNPNSTTFYSKFFGSSSSMRGSVSGVNSKGLRSSKFWPEYLASNPPPFFPGTNQYKISYYEVNYK